MDYYLSLHFKTKKNYNSSKAKRKKYRNSFYTSKDSIFITTWEGHLIEVNDAAVEMFGYKTKEEFKKTKVREFYLNPEERKEFLNCVLKNGYTRAFPVKMKRKDDSIIHTIVSSALLKDDKGKIKGFQGTIKDITDRIQSEKQISLQTCLMK